MFTHPLLSFYRGFFDGKLVDKEIVRDEDWFIVHFVDWLAFDAGCDVVGDAFAKGVRHFVVVDAIVHIRLGSSY